DTKKISRKKLSKKEARKIVSQKIATALEEYRSTVKEKKFDNNIKMASKLFAADIAKAIARQKQKLQKPSKIKAVKSKQPEEQSNSAEAVV
ncbi:MAG TPA: hypothetical protein VGG71_03470, partial [Chitinophagaceae bacterium]